MNAIVKFSKTGTKPSGGVNTRVTLIADKPIARSAVEGLRLGSGQLLGRSSAGYHCIQLSSSGVSPKEAA